MKKNAICILFLICNIFLYADNYTYTIKAGETITIDIPTVCIEFENKTPESSDSFLINPELTENSYFINLLKAKNAILNDIANFMVLFEINYAVIQAEKKANDESLIQLESLLNGMGDFENSDFDYNDMDDLTEMTEELTDLMSFLMEEEPAVNSDDLPAPSKEEELELFIYLLGTAFQNACWMINEEFSSIMEIEGTTETEVIISELTMLLRDMAFLLE